MIDGYSNVDGVSINSKEAIEFHKKLEKLRKEIRECCR